MSVEHKYSPIEGSEPVDNKLEVEEDISIGVNTSASEGMLIKNDDVNEYGSTRNIADITSPTETTETADDKLQVEEEGESNSVNNSHSEVTMTFEIGTRTEPISEKGTSKTFLYITACIANLIALTAGITLGWTSPELPKLESNITSPLSPPSSPTQSAWIGSLLPLGATFGPFAAGILADKIGRKRTLLISGVPFVLAFVTATFAKSALLFYFLRFACGLGVGGVFTVLPMYIGEIADDSVRGALGSFMQLFITGGLLFSYALGPYLSITIFNTICLIPPILFLFLFFTLMPESPHYLLAASKEKEAITALSKLRATSDVKAELESLKQSVEEAQANKGSFADIFKSKATTKALILSLALVTFQQFSGINIILFYTYAVIGGSIAPEIATIMVGVMQVSFSFITPIFVERKGKRFLLLFSAIGMTISLAGMAIFFRMMDVGASTNAVFWLPILSLVVYNAAYCSGFGPLPWAIMGEIFPANIKSAASTLTASVCWFLAFLITKYFSMVSATIGAGFSFLIFSVCCVIATLFTYKLVPETSGKSLQEIQEILEGRQDNGTT